MPEVTVAGGATVGVGCRALECDGLGGVQVHQGNVPTFGYVELANFENLGSLLLVYAGVFQLLTIAVEGLPVYGCPVLCIASSSTLLDDFAAKDLDVFHGILDGLWTIVLHIIRIGKYVKRLR